MNKELVEKVKQMLITNNRMSISYELTARCAIKLVQDDETDRMAGLNSYSTTSVSNHTKLTR